MGDAEQQQARQYIEQAIELISAPEKEAYLEAMAKAPGLCATEASPLKFLRCCDYNLWDAAQRLCRYWEERKDLFKERAFLPMTLTGNGALDKKEILNLQAGFNALLPERTKDGRLVLYMDRRQWIPCSEQSRLRLFFYMVSVMSEDDVAQTKGIVLLYLLTTPRLKEVNFAIIKRGAAMSARILPVKFNAVFLNCLPKTKKEYRVQDLIATFVQSCVSSGVDLVQQIEVVLEREAGETFKYLTEELGLSASSIPTLHGGTWSFSESLLWCRRRATIERDRFGEQIAYASSVQTSERVHGETTSDEVASLSKQETKLVKKRAINVLHSRRKRQRRQQELQDLKNEAAGLERENQNLKATQAHLQALLDQANRITPSMGELPTSLPHYQTNEFDSSTFF